MNTIFSIMESKQRRRSKERGITSSKMAVSTKIAVTSTVHNQATKLWFSEPQPLVET